MGVWAVVLTVKFSAKILYTLAFKAAWTAISSTNFVKAEDESSVWPKTTSICTDITEILTQQQNADRQTDRQMDGFSALYIVDREESVELL